MLALTPLDRLLWDKGLDSRFEAPNTACWREHVASWAIRRRHLWLEEVRAYVRETTHLVEGLQALVRIPEPLVTEGPQRLADFEGLVFIDPDYEGHAAFAPGFWFRGLTR